jgi:hypothetical protein
MWIISMINYVYPSGVCSNKRGGYSSRREDKKKNYIETIIEAHVGECGIGCLFYQ